MRTSRLAVLLLAALVAAPVVALTLNPPAASPAPGSAAPSPGSDGARVEPRGLEGALERPIVLGELMDAEDVPSLPEALGLQAASFAARIEVEPGRSGAEPGIDVHPNGCVFIHAIGARSLWVQCPSGGFYRLNPPGFVIAGLDAEVAIDPGTGNVFYSDLWLGSAGITASRNVGGTWTTNNPMSLLVPVDDRQWLAPLGNDQVLLVTNQIPSGITATRCILLPATAAPVACGTTALVAPVATRFCVCPPGQPAASADGQDVIIPYYAIRNLNPDLVPLIKSDQVIEVALSHDNGLTWKAVTAATSSGDPGIFPVGAIDAAGNAYVAWAAQRGSGQAWDIWLARSFDGGETWLAPVKVSQGGSNVMPWIAAGAGGHVALSWYHADQQAHPESVTGDWFLDFAQSFDMDQPAPTVQRSRPSDAPIHADDLSIGGLTGSADRDLLDFQQVALDANGLAHIAYSDDKTDGHNGHAHVYYVRQTA